MADLIVLPSWLRASVSHKTRQKHRQHQSNSKLAKAFFQDQDYLNCRFVSTADDAESHLKIFKSIT